MCRVEWRPPQVHSQNQNAALSGHRVSRGVTLEQDRSSSNMAGIFVRRGSETQRHTRRDDGCMTTEQ